MEISVKGRKGRDGVIGKAEKSRCRIPLCAFLGETHAQTSHRRQLENV
jgi:hypothetical protein